ncbi:hypothetical protein BDN67DRAFT_965227 [Paxillus ammoniavirescens]|nr:hypothetical protein BDN67DRAFT_965227 [Paxillus ammoniavirescens]
MLRCSPSVVVTTTSSHVHAGGTVDDPQDEEFLTIPRGSSLRCNLDTHDGGAGPEIWRQTNEKLDAFVSAGESGLSSGTLFDGVDIWTGKSIAGTDQVNGQGQPYRSRIT